MGTSFRRRWPLAAVTLASALLAAGCGAKSETGGAASSSGTSAKLGTASLITSFYVDASDAGYLAADEQGMDKDNGVDLKIVPGKGSEDTLQRLVSGKVDFGLVDAAVLTNAVAQDPNSGLVMIAMLQQSTMNSAIYVEGRDVRSIEDLAHAKFGNSGGSAATQYPAFVSKAVNATPHFPTTQLDSSTRLPALLKDEVDVVASVIVEQPELDELADKDHLKIGTFRFADHGFNPYGYGIVARRDYLKEHPDVAKAVVKSVLEGWAWTAQHIDEAAALYQPFLANPNRDIAIAEVKLATPLVTGGDAQANGIGTMTEKRWRETVDLAAEGFGIAKKSVPDPSDLYDTQYLPATPLLATDHAGS